ncbi:class F sortase [Kitasatospora atroaurantiaca]|uniref:Sortase family protein n=1 Tax=Kitasatospora atroaurantiaca TaxID=285545 RepID=A0A561ES88_9ACTN|nr:class F sortase [Kitasatospora atroaurantiaca]TWE18466.1 sortase family protein [Kitasatospora atroaurantiaca]
MSRRRPRFVCSSLLAAGVTLGIGAWMVYGGTRTEAPPHPAAADAFPTRLGTPSPTATVPAVPTMPFSKPTRIRIPRVGIDAPVTAVGLDDSGRLVPPETDRNLAGWYQESVPPGSVGNSVLVGHVDTMRGPAVFYALGALHRGDTIDITRADSSTAEFSVDAIEVYAKADFPSDRVYAATTRPELRLITCGGGYTRSTGYLGNVVVYGHLTKALPGP